MVASHAPLRQTAGPLLVLLAAGAVLAIAWALSGQQLGVFPLSAAITGLGAAFAALVVAEMTLLLRLDALRRDEAADTSAYNALMGVLVAGVLIALGFAATGTQLGIVPLSAAVTALGVTAAILTVTLAAMLFSLRLPQQTTQPAPADGVMTGSAPKPMVHIEAVEEAEHVLNIEGIGARYATRLNSHGIITIPQLLRADAVDIAPKIGATAERVKQWQGMADLSQVKGIGPQSAEVLVHIGIMSIGALAEADPTDIVQRVADAEAKRKVRIQGTDVKPGIAKRWIEAAQAHRREVLGVVSA